MHPFDRCVKQLFEDCLALDHKSLGGFFGTHLNPRKDSGQVWAPFVLVALEFAHLVDNRLRCGEKIYRKI
jgi:hypothetical protein